MKWIRKIHLYVSVFVGLQLLIWLLSGLYFNVMDSEKVSGRLYFQQPLSTPINNESIISPKQLLDNIEPVTELKLVTRLHQQYYLAYFNKELYPHFKQNYRLFDAVTGSLKIVDKQFAQELAQRSYTGNGKIRQTTYMAQQEELLKDKNSSFRVDFNDHVNTSVYIDANSGRVIGHVNDDKRLANFFFMLHFMDYSKQGSFNNTFMMIFAFAVLWLAVTGFIWFLHLVKRRQYRLKMFKLKSNLR